MTSTATAAATGTMTAGEAFAAIMEDHGLTAGFAIGVLDNAEGAYPAPCYATVPRGFLTVRFASPENVTLRLTPGC